MQFKKLAAFLGVPFALLVLISTTAFGDSLPNLGFEEAITNNVQFDLNGKSTKQCVALPG